MRNVFLVIKHEIVSTIGKRSFWLTTFVLPVVLFGFSFGAQYISLQSVEAEPDLMEEDAVALEADAVGYVDLAGIINEMPPGIPAELVIRYESENAAQAALEAGDVVKYYVIPADYVDSGDLILVDSEFSPFGAVSSSGALDYIIKANLTGDVELALLASNPIRSQIVTSKQVMEDLGEEQGDTSMRFLVGIAVLFVFFIVLTFSSSFMLRSVAKEKENRTVEILLVSIKPRELMLGKVLGLGVVALLQMAFWGGGSLLIGNQASSLPFEIAEALAGGISLPTSFYVWAVPYFVLGYILYAAVLGAIGALAPNARETGQFTFLALLPLMIPMWLNSAFISNPHGPLATFLSLFPLTSPTSMLPRLANGGVPAWQPVVGIVLLLGATYAFVLLAARFFRADTLLSDDALDWKRITREFRNGKKA